MVRSILLRGFDQDMADRIGKNMEEHVCYFFQFYFELFQGIKLIRECVPTKYERLPSGRVKVTAKNNAGLLID